MNKRYIFYILGTAVLSACVPKPAPLPESEIPTSYNASHMTLLVRNRTTAPSAELNWFKHVAGKPFSAEGRFSKISESHGNTRAVAIVNNLKVSCKLDAEKADQYRQLVWLTPVRISGNLAWGSADGVGLDQGCTVKALKSGPS